MRLFWTRNRRIPELSFANWKCIWHWTVRRCNPAWKKTEEKPTFNFCSRSFISSFRSTSLTAGGWPSALSSKRTPRLGSTSSRMLSQYWRMFVALMVRASFRTCSRKSASAVTYGKMVASTWKTPHKFHYIPCLYFTTMESPWKTTYVVRFVPDRKSDWLIRVNHSENAHYSGEVKTDMLQQSRVRLGLCGRSLFKVDIRTTNDLTDGFHHGPGIDGIYETKDKVSQLINQSINWLIHPWMHSCINQSINGSIHPSTNPSIDGSNNQSTNRLRLNETNGAFFWNLFVVLPHSPSCILCFVAKYLQI